MINEMLELPVSVLVEHNDPAAEDADAVCPKMRKVVFFMQGDTLMVRDMSPEIQYCQDDDLDEDQTQTCELMAFINSAVTILNSPFANAFLSDLALVYPAGEGLVRYIPDRNRDIVNICHGFIIGWEENATSCKFLSLKNKDEIEEEDVPSEQEHAADAISLIFSYILLSRDTSPIIREHGHTITGKYLGKLEGASTNE